MIVKTDCETDGSSAALDAMVRSDLMSWWLVLGGCCALGDSATQSVPSSALGPGRRRLGITQYQDNAAAVTRAPADFHNSL